MLSPWPSHIIETTLFACALGLVVADVQMTTQTTTLSSRGTAGSMACPSASGGAAGSWPEHGETDPPHTDSALKAGHGNVRARLCVENDADAVMAIIPWRQRRLINAW